MAAAADLPICPDCSSGSKTGSINPVRRPLRAPDRANRERLTRPIPMCATADQIGYFQRTVARGEYKVDSERVAAAMLQRIGALALADRDVSARGDRVRRGDDCPPPRHR